MPKPENKQKKKIDKDIHKATEPRVEYADDEIIVGPRTVAMSAFLKNFPAYNRGTNLLRLGNKNYTPLTAGVKDISTKAVASCGSTSEREIVILDPENSPLLEAHFQAILKGLKGLRDKGPLSEEIILTEIINYVRSYIFPSRKDPDLEEKVAKFIKQMEEDPTTLKTQYKENGVVKEVVVLPIDTIIKSRLGVCRHFAMAIANILDRLTKEPDPLLEGIVQHMRDNVVQDGVLRGGHVWVTFLSKKENKRWHVDALWKELVDFGQPKGIERLQILYGTEAIANQILKANGVLKEEPIEFKAKDRMIGLLNQQVLELDSQVADAFLSQSGRGKGRYILRRLPPDHFSISYIDQNKKNLRIRMEIQADGQLKVKDKTYRDFNALKEELKLTKHYSRQEYRKLIEITSKIVDGCENLEQAVGALKKHKIPGSFTVIQSPYLEDAFALQFYKSEHDQGSIQFAIMQDGKILAIKNKEQKTYEDFGAMIKSLGLKEDWDPAKIKEDGGITSKERTLELLNQEVVNANPMLIVLIEEFLKEPGRGKGRYMVRPSKTRGFDFTICYLDQNKNYASERITIQANGQIKIDDKIYLDFNALKEGLKLTKHYSFKELKTTIEIESKIVKGYETTQATIGFLEKYKVPGSFMVRKSSNDDVFTLQQLGNIATRFMVSTDGRICIIKNDQPNFYENFQAMIKDLGLKEDWDPEKIQENVKITTREKTLELMNQEVFQAGPMPVLHENPISKNDFLKESGSKGRYMIVPSMTPDYDFTISYLDQNKNYVNALVAVQDDGKLKIGDEIFRDFDTLKEKLKLTKNYSYSEMTRTAEISSKIVNGYKTSQEVTNAFARHPVPGSFMIRKSQEDENAFVVHKQDNTAVRFKITEEGRILVITGPLESHLYEDFKALIKALGLKEDWDPLKMRELDGLLPKEAVMQESEKKTRELLNKEIANITSEEQDKMMLPSGRGRNCYILTKEGNDYRICYKNESGHIVKKLIKTNEKGEIIFDDQKFPSFEDFKKKLNLQKPYTESEIKSTLFIQSIITAEYDSLRKINAIMNVLQKGANFKICFSDNQDSFLIFYRHESGKIISRNLEITSDGKFSVATDEMTTIYDTFHKLLNGLKVSKPTIHE